VGLRAADVVEIDVELALDATGGVVRRTSVPEENDPSGQARDPTARSAARARSASSKGMTGQSFQSRSRA
jgi:hypothetical protein